MYGVVGLVGRTVFTAMFAKTIAHLPTHVLELQAEYVLSAYIQPSFIYHLMLGFLFDTN